MGTRKTTEVTDSLMGTGKTNNLIERVNSSDSQTRWFIVTPLLTETIRIANACPDKRFHLPELTDLGRSKEPDLIWALNSGKNIITTHSMFEHFALTPAVKETISQYGYRLVIDETLEVVSLLDETKKDISLLFNQGIIAVDENDRIYWLDKDYAGKFRDTMRLIKRGNVYWYNKAAFKIFPVEKFDAFPEIEVLTYLFEGSPMHFYLSISGYSFRFFNIQNGVRISGKHDFYNEKCKIKEEIAIYDGKYNIIGESNALTSSWFKDKKRCSPDRMKDISKATYNYLYNICEANSKNAMWTIFKSHREKCVLRGYKNSYLACNARATNEYGGCKYLAYLLNRYNNPIVKHWFSDHSVNLDDDKIALSELVQWIWRSAIRNDQEIMVFIPSTRMRTILINWLNSSNN